MKENGKGELVQMFADTEELSSPEEKGPESHSRKPKLTNYPVGKVGDSAEKLRRIKKRRKLLMQSRMRLIKQFANAAREKFGNYVKAVVVFGSYARGDFTLGSDTDVLVLIDDTESEHPVDEDLRQKLHEKLQGLANQVAGDTETIHVQLHILTEFWDYLRTGDALFFNYLRTGLAVYDAGFFKPAKRLLLSGNIKPSKEAIFKSIDGAKGYIDKISSYMEWAVERLYRAVTWSANGYLMAAGMPPAEIPELVPVMRKYFVEKGKLSKEHVDTLEEIIKLQKDIEHAEMKGITPEKVAELKVKAEAMVNVMEEGVKDFIEGKKKAEELKEKIRTTPKIFWVYAGVDARGYAWLFEHNVFIAIYEGKDLRTVLEAQIGDEGMGEFKEVDPKKLFSSLEEMEFKPVITPGLVTLILNNMPEDLRKELEKTGVEFPGRALVDLSEDILPGRKDDKGAFEKEKGKD